MLTEAQLAQLVDTFYEKVRNDDRLGALFNSAVHDWPEHIARLAAFWSSVMLGSGRFKGSPMAAHLRHGGEIRPEMFDRWLALWAETAGELLALGDSVAIRTKAERIAESLKRALFFRLEPASSRAAA